MSSLVLSQLSAHIVTLRETIVVSKPLAQTTTDLLEACRTNIREKFSDAASFENEACWLLAQCDQPHHAYDLAVVLGQVSRRLGNEARCANHTVSAVAHYESAVGHFKRAHEIARQGGKRFVLDAASADMGTGYTQAQLTRLSGTTSHDAKLKIFNHLVLSGIAVRTCSLPKDPIRLVAWTMIADAARIFKLDPACMAQYADSAWHVSSWSASIGQQVDIWMADEPHAHLGTIAKMLRLARLLLEDWETAHRRQIHHCWLLILNALKNASEAQRVVDPQGIRQLAHAEISALAIHPHQLRPGWTK